MAKNNSRRRRGKGRIIHGKVLSDPTQLNKKFTRRINKNMIDMLEKLEIDVSDYLPETEEDLKKLKRLIVRRINEYNKQFVQQSLVPVQTMSRLVADRSEKQTKETMSSMITKVQNTYSGVNSLNILKDYFSSGATADTINKKIDKIVLENIRENVKLITKLNEQVKLRLINVINKAYLEKKSPAGAIQKFILKGKKKPLYMVERLVSHQNNLLNVAVSKTVLVGSGFDTYTWRHTSISKEPRPMHISLNGSIQRWDDPPVADPNGGRYHPGEQIGCNCMAIPILIINNQGK